MTLVEDYLRAVSLLLPKDQRDDITAELRDTILSRIEEREAVLRRPLTDDETEAVLREIGHPLVVAARYREGPQHVVGPTLYPYWLFAVKAAVTIQACVAVLIFTVRLVSGTEFGRALTQAFGTAFSGAISLIGFATLAAWLIERRTVKIDYLDNWRVKDLRVLEFASWDWNDWRSHMGATGAEMAAARGPVRTGALRSEFGRREFGRRRRERHRASRAMSIIVTSSVFVLWWAGVLRFGFSASPDGLRSIGVEPGALATFDWAGLKAELFWPVLSYSVFTIFQGFWLLARPLAVRAQGAMDLGMGACIFALVAWLIALSPLAPTLGADTLAGWALRVRDAGREGPNFPMAECLAVTIAITALVGLGRVTRGLWLLVDPHPYREGGV
ncbi:hypothetical protein BH09PSE2_BH09PSE2_05940 [soil metagenome]